MLKLDKRLRAILNEINCDVLADIGCDHAKVAVSAILENRAKKIICVDKSKESLKKAEELINKFGISEKAELVCCDGFCGIKKSFDVAVIAGMGGLEIIKILEEKDYKGDLILVPHQDAELLRAYINKRFFIEKDFVVCSCNKFYSIIVAKKGESSYLDEEISFGFIDKNNLDFLNMLRYKRKKLEKIVPKIKDTANEINEKYREVIALCQKLGI